MKLLNFIRKKLKVVIPPESLLTQDRSVSVLDEILSRKPSARVFGGAVTTEGEGK